MKKVKYEHVAVHRKICEVYSKHRLPNPKRPIKNIEWFHVYAKLQQLNKQPAVTYSNYEHYFSKLKLLLGFTTTDIGTKHTWPKKARKQKLKPSKRKRNKKIPNNFYSTWEWKKLRYEAFMLYGRQCLCCGFAPEIGSKNHLCVDHVKPISKYPHLALDINNLQILCHSCNRGKSNIYYDDFRQDAEDELTKEFLNAMERDIRYDH